MPSVHLWQEDLSALLWYPAGQATQIPFVVELDANPAAHNVHWLADPAPPAEDVLPSAQREHFADESEK
jgi:hypothetical protein